MIRPIPTARLLRLGGAVLATVAASTAVAHGAAGLGFAPAPDAPSSARAGEALFPRAEGMAPGERRANRVTMRNDGSEPVDLVLQTSHLAGTGADADLCRALELAIRDRVTGRSVRTVAVGDGPPARIARLLPGETGRYRAEIRFAPRSGHGASGHAQNALQGATCGVDFAWSFAPTA